MPHNNWPAAVRQTRSLGRAGEDRAVEYLQARGLEILDRNWRCRQGEIDIVAKDGPELVIVEVKTRSGSRYGSPIEAVNAQKHLRLRLLAGVWVHAHQLKPCPLRIDVIGVDWRGELPIIDHRERVIL